MCIVRAGNLSGTEVIRRKNVTKRKEGRKEGQGMAGKRREEKGREERPDRRNARE